MDCPNCGLFNPREARSCDCGWNFETREVVVDPAAVDHSSSFIVLQRDAGKILIATILFGVVSFIVAAAIPPDTTERLVFDLFRGVLFWVGVIASAVGYIRRRRRRRV